MVTIKSMFLQYVTLSLMEKPVKTYQKIKVDVALFAYQKGTFLKPV